MNCKVIILGKSFYSPSLKDVAGLESVQLDFYFPSICLYIIFSLRTASVCGNMDKYK